MPSICNGITKPRQTSAFKPRLKPEGFCDYNLFLCRYSVFAFCHKAFRIRHKSVRSEINN